MLRVENGLLGCEALPQLAYAVQRGEGGALTKMMGRHAVICLQLHQNRTNDLPWGPSQSAILLHLLDAMLLIFCGC